MSILQRIKGAMIADFEVRTPREFRAGICPWCHRAWSEEDSGVHINVDRETGRDVIVHDCGWVLSGSDIRPEDIR